MLDAHRPLIISGMGRSGTSLAARYLQVCGLSLGDSLIGPRRGNRFGHFEQKAIVDFHNRLLRKNGHSAYSVGLSRDETLEFTDEDVQEARDHCAQFSRSDGPWGWKDPRTVLFVDLWEQVCPNATYLLMVRAPEEVGASLVRSAYSKTHLVMPWRTYRIWLRYNTAVLKATERLGDRALVVPLEFLLMFPGKVVERVNKNLGGVLRQESFARAFEPDALHRGAHLPLARVLRFFAPREVLSCHQVLFRLGLESLFSSSAFSTLPGPSTSVSSK